MHSCDGCCRPEPSSASCWRGSRARPDTGGEATISSWLVLGVVELTRFGGHPRSGAVAREGVHHGDHGQEAARPRRSFTPEFKADPGDLIGRDFTVNPNVIKTRWLRGHHRPPHLAGLALPRHGDRQCVTAGGRLGPRPVPGRGRRGAPLRRARWPMPGLSASLPATRSRR
jgi:hypothetical protein